LDRTSLISFAKTKSPPDWDVLRGFFDALADKCDFWRQRNRYYHDDIERLCHFVVPDGAKVLEIGCGTGGLLASVNPSEGLGIDLSPKMVQIARRKHPHLRFEVGNAELLAVEESFDFVILSDLLGYLQDIQKTFSQLPKVVERHTRVFVTHYNTLWGPILKLAEMLGLKMPQPRLNWLPMKEVENLLELAGFEVVRRGYHLLVPKSIPLISPFANRILAKMPGIRRLCLLKVLVAKPIVPPEEPEFVSCSVVVPCLNERGNIEAVVTRIPAMGSGTEIVFVDGASTDGTREEIERCQAAYPEQNVKLVDQGDGVGKGDAVRKGFTAARGDVLMILDADLTVPPEVLPRFFDVLVQSRAEMVNGTRLVYPMQQGAMRFLNLLGNRVFSLILSCLLEQRVRDTLCGTKALLKSDYERISAQRAYFSEIDPFGDFDLLFGAAKQNLKIVDVPIRYQRRSYGITKIHRMGQGWILFRMCIVATRKLKLI
jgi:SAM-dependent methyltransferase